LASVHGFRGSEVQGSKVQRFRGSKVQRFKVQGFKVYRFRGSKVGTDEHRSPYTAISGILGLPTG